MVGSPTVLPTQPPNIAKIVAEQGYDDMQPIAGPHTTFAEVFAPEDFLAEHGDHHSMLHIMVQGIATG